MFADLHVDCDSTWCKSEQYKYPFFPFLIGLSGIYLSPHCTCIHHIINIVEADKSIQRSLVEIYRSIVANKIEQAEKVEREINYLDFKISLSSQILSGNVWKDESNWIAMYEKALSIDQPSHRKLLYPKQQDQTIRHQAIVNLIKSPTNLLDVGCGFGDMATSLENAQVIPSLYVGIDAVADFVKIARELHPENDGVKFIHSLLEDFHPISYGLPERFDYVIACSIQLGADLNEFAETLNRLWRLGENVVFNFLAAERYRGMYLSYWTPDIVRIVSHIAYRYDIHMLPEVSDVTVKMSRS